MLKKGCGGPNYYGSAILIFEIDRATRVRHRCTFIYMRTIAKVLRLHQTHGQPDTLRRRVPRTFKEGQGTTRSFLAPSHLAFNL